MIVSLLELVGVYIVGYNMILSHMFINMKYGASNFHIPNISVIVGKTVGDVVGWQPISAISLQQSFQI